MSDETMMLIIMITIYAVQIGAGIWHAICEEKRS